MPGIKYVFYKSWNIKGWEINAKMLRKENAWGRFGGGWNWSLGFMACDRTVVINLLVMSIIVRRSKNQSIGREG